MGPVGILYFSGTGNTWRVARQYAQAFADRGHKVDPLAVEEVAGDHPPARKADVAVGPDSLLQRPRRTLALT